MADYPDWTDLVHIIGTDIMVAIDLQGAYIMMPVDIQAQYLTLDINIKAAAVTLDINITAQDVDINIATSSTQNIVIDKLVQDAFTARIFTLQNDNDVATPAAPPSSRTGATYYGKFFPRGCRGMLESLSIYCKKTASGTLTLSYAPTPGMGAVDSVEVTPLTDWDWVEVDIQTMWNYDSLFVWVSACSADVSYGKEAVVPYDEFSSSDYGATWAIESSRLFIRASLGGATVGDLPVSGTLNTVAIPASATQSESGLLGITANTSKDMIKIYRAGACEWLMLFVQAATNSHKTGFSIYCDGDLVYSSNFYTANFFGLNTITPGITISTYNVDGICMMIITTRLEFRHKFHVEMTANDHDVIGYALAILNLVK